MSYGMPKSYDQWRLASPPDDDHHPRCACHEDADEIYSECGGVGECTCAGTHGVDGAGTCLVKTPDCTCADLADDDKASAADAKASAREEGWERP